MELKKPISYISFFPINRAPLAHFGIPRILMDQSDRLHICCSSQPVYKAANAHL